jgi:CheY-like chemotaxis protein
LSVVSELGRGSTVSFRIDTGPLKSVSSRPLRNHDLQPRRVEEERAITSRFQGKVLVADNDYDIRQTLALSLEPLGLEVVLASNGRDALRAARRLDFHLVLLDTQLAALDGLAATRLLRRHGFSNPIVAMTDNPLEQEDCRQAGFTRMLLKPVQLDHLLLCLQRTLPQAAGSEPSGGGTSSHPSRSLSGEQLMRNMVQGLNDPEAATPETQTALLSAIQDHDEDDTEMITPIPSIDVNPQPQPRLSRFGRQ